MRSVFGHVEQAVGKAKGLKIKNINFDLSSLDSSVSNGIVLE
jgi:hypothetical protein